MTIASSLLRVPAWPCPGRLRCLVLLLLVVSLACAGDVTVAPGALELDPQDNVPAMPGDVAEPEAEPDAAGRRRGEFVIAPLPSRNPLLGWTLAVPALYLYKPQFTQPEDSVWLTGAAVFYAENESLGGGLFHKMSLGGDQWRMTAAAFTAEIRYDYFGIGGSPDRALPLEQDMDLLIAEALYRVRPNLYLGLNAMAGQTSTAIDLPPDLFPPGIDPPRLSLDIDLALLSPKLVFDTRDNEFYPRDGWLVEGKLGISRTGIGSDLDYERHSWAANRYLGLTERGTLALRAVTQYVGGDAPFFAYPAFGSGSDLRGYQTGTYRDRFLFAAQAEWRQRLAPRWGVVAFAGIGTVDPDFAHWGKSLPAVGVGLRWVVAPQNNLSLRIDAAWGRGENEFYISIGEAF